MTGNQNFLQFSRPFLDALKETMSLMAQTEIKAHSPKIKTTAIAHGDISALIGMNGKINSNGGQKDFKGLMVISWPEPVYIKMASRMLYEDYTEYCDDISDSGAEIVNIVMGNSKAALNKLGFQIEMASPSTIRGKAHEIKYPANTTVVEIVISSDIGDFTLELCYQEI
jgi:chemotaxis protein CheX